MEPTTTSNKSKTIIIVVLVFIILVVAWTLFKNKSNPNSITPNQNNQDSNNQVTGNIDTTINPDQITKDIAGATTFDNEADLKEVDKSFQ